MMILRLIIAINIIMTLLQVQGPFRHAEVLEKTVALSRKLPRRESMPGSVARSVEGDGGVEIRSHGKLI